MRSKKAMYNIITNLLLQIIIVLYGFIVPKIIIESFGSNVNGLIASITQFLGYITLLESGFGPVVKSILYKPISKNDNSEISNILRSSEKFFRRIAIVFLVYIIVLSFIYPMLVNKEMEFLYTATLVVIISISTFAEYYFGMTYKLYLQAKQKSYIISLIQIITYIICIIFVVIMAKLKCSIHIIKLVSGIIFILRPILQNMYVRKKFSINLKNADNNYSIDNKWDGLSQHIAYVIHSNTDITILTIFRNLSEVSIYSVYFLVVKGVKSIIQSFSVSIDSTFGDMIARNENDNLKNKFNLYEIIYNSICVICFSCAMVLIVPFISVYTKGVNDTNYIQYLFGYLIVISEYIWALMQPYSQLTFAAGKFKETKKGAWIEALLNIIVSIIFVNKYGLVGVTIGTIVAVGFRAIEYIFFTNKNILKRNVISSVYKLIIAIIQTVIIVLICRNINSLSNSSYISWFLNAIVILFVSLLVVLSTSIIFYIKELKEIIGLINKKLNKR